MKPMLILVGLLISLSTGYSQGTSDVIQSNISGNNLASSLGNPFGQSFVPSSLQLLYGIGLAVVDNSGADDIQVFLYHTDSTGATLVGNFLASGKITAAQINAFYTPGATPLWFPVYFNQPYTQTPGEKLAFTATGGGSLLFYYAAGSSYADGRMLGDAGKDLTFATLVPEPAFFSLGLFASIALFAGHRKLKGINGSGNHGPSDNGSGA
jgi:hypothetical protein